MEKYERAKKILPTLRECTGDDVGLVGELENRNLLKIKQSLKKAGYDVSDSRDDNDVEWIWVSV